ncbi:MAG: hypothetical protein E7589_01395 [Ruminococcaceae bacterium]|nr:hypothetical protein [Oscillospiraceae bacterium]
MGMYVFKMFKPGLVCRDYQFKVGVNECEHATCVREGFHAVENPLDCLSYYPDFDSSECWLCYADGDIHEDGTDSKISCTRLEILRRLGKLAFVYEAGRYIVEHPLRPLASCVFKNHGRSSSNGFAVVVGYDPKAQAERDGDILCLVKKGKEGEPWGLSILCEDTVRKGKWYNFNGEEVKVGEHETIDSGTD